MIEKIKMILLISNDLDLFHVHFNNKKKKNNLDVKKVFTLLLYRIECN